MPEVTTEFLKKVVMLAKSAGQLEKKSADVKKAAPAAVDALISAGLIAQQNRNAWIEKLASDPVCWLDTLKKVASKVGARSLGAPAGNDKSESQLPKGRNANSDAFFQAKFLGR